MIHRQPMADKVKEYGDRIVKYRDKYRMTFPRIARRWGKGTDWAYRIYLEKKKEGKDDT